MAKSTPSVNFKEISVLPTHEEILTHEEPFLRENKIEGQYDNEEHYLDVQFRLLREDFIRPLREGIQQLMAMGTNMKNRDDRLQDVRVYENVRILVPVCTSNGVAYRIRFDIARFQRVQWENSKRLIFGSLLCLSKDNFKSFAFATVVNRELKDIRKGEIEVRFVSLPSQGRLRTGDLCQMVESIAFFEAYRPVLEGLKMMPPGKFPFKRYIVECNRDIHPPAYLTKPEGQQVTFDFSAIISNEECHGNTCSYPKEENNNSRIRKSESRVTVLNPASWPSAKDLELDESQLEALHLALTKEFAVIQGPPGTGKTYIGLKIAKVLLHNARVWRSSKDGPILVVCYTNHALDQFLEEIQEFHPSGIVRVGGRSQSEAMQRCSLTKRKREMIEKHLLPRKLGIEIREIRQEMDRLSQKITSYGRMLEKFTSNVVHEDEFLNLNSMTSKQYASLKAGSFDTIGRRASVIPQWLGLPVPPADPYQNGFARPLGMFPFTAECRGLEYFSQTDLAFITPSVRHTPGADGLQGGSLQLDGTYESFIEIPNYEGGWADARQSITLLAFIYPMESSGPVISYGRNGYGVQIWQEGLYGGMGILSAWFVGRDLALAFPLKKAVLHINAWNFIGTSYDRVTGVARLWHNGNEVEAIFIGENFELATQFSIRVGAWESPWQTYYFKGRISHLHIYDEALTVSNIRAVGCIPPTEGYKPSTLEEVENSTEGGDEESGKEAEKPPDITFEAYIMQDQRILETDDDIIRFQDRLPDANTDNLSTTRSSDGAEGGLQGGGWQFQNPSRVKKRIKQIIRRELDRQDALNEQEAAEVNDVWDMPLKERWRMYRRWVWNASQRCHDMISDWQETFDEKANNLKEKRMKEDYEILRKADVIGMTTTGAARYHRLLQDMQPVITIVEEAAEVLEAHIITSLSPGCQHVILIGDHQQLRPSPTVYDLQINYNLDVSLFERMVKNGMQFSRLCLQHRMRPEIAKMLDHIYAEPKLQNHESVLNFEDIKGVERNLFFVDHNEKEDFVAEGKSRSNVHEAKFLTALCRYFIQQGYQRKQITILTAYSGQLFKLKQEMSLYKNYFEGVRVTVVDNFQGEENDIILLSLVRSERIGFLKILNRVCVALSRARKGFYIVGNATLLARDSDLWRNIFADMRQEEKMGNHLKLTCQNHSQNEINASCAEDFKDAPEGGCKESCAMKLDCGHVCDQKCHPIDLEHKERFACQQSCNKTCDFGHKCSMKCSEECGPCMVQVPKIIPECNHEQQIPCSVDPIQFKCRKVVPRQATPCGHVNEVKCCAEIIVCKEPCGTLECGHLCLGNCDLCQEGRFHLPCESTCRRTLFCDHTCTDACVRTCPPCSAPCSNYCDHKRCTLNCGHPCHRCREECTWQCPHQKCTVPCGEICNRPRCDEPCLEMLSCGHSCIGVCGEVCPAKCRVCNKDEFSESKPGTMFVELRDCQHVFEVEELDQWMDQTDAKGENKDVEIKLKRCPKCRTPILHSRRYGTIVKTILADFEAVKRRIVLSDVADSAKIQTILMEVKEIKRSFKVESEEIVQSITKGHVTSEEVIKRQNQLTFLKFLDEIIVKYKINEESNKELYHKIHFLIGRLMKKRPCFSEQEIKEVSEELSRTKLLASIAELDFAAISLGPEDSRNMNPIKSALESGKAICQQQKEEFVAHINKINKNQGLTEKDEEVNISEPREMVVKAKNLALGPWYKCSKDHVYSIAERVEGEGSTLTCPECLAGINNQTTRSQPEAVSTQYSRVE